MTRTIANRRGAGIVLAAVALGTAAPTASARPFNVNQQGSFVPVSPPPAQAVPPTSSHANGGDISELGYVAIGSGAVSLALISVGGTRTASRRRQQRRIPGQSTIAA